MVQNRPCLYFSIFLSPFSALFAYDFFAKPLPAGYYTLVVSAQKSGGSPFQTELKVNILTSVDIVNAELIISDVDVGSKTTK